jgi:hypothetical protein
LDYNSQQQGKDVPLEFLQVLSDIFWQDVGGVPAEGETVEA